MSWKTYRLYRKKVLAIRTIGNIDGRYLDREWSPTEVTFRARSLREANKKADAFWTRGEFGIGSIMVVECPE